MDFLRTVLPVLLYGTSGLLLPFFLLCLLLLAWGIAAQVRSDALHLRFIERRPLNWIELTHPYLPSPRVLLIFCLCAFTLLVVGLQTLQHVFPFNDPYQGLFVVAFFFLATALGILGNLWWKAGRLCAAAFILGTAAAFFVFILLLPSAAASVPLLERLALAACMLATSLVAWRTLQRNEDASKMGFMAGVVFLLWMLLASLQ